MRGFLFFMIINMSKNSKQTSNKIVKLAVEVLHDPNSSQIQRRLAWSALSQTNTTNQTSAEMEDIAARVLQSSKYSDDTLSLAWSILSQSNKLR